MSTEPNRPRAYFVVETLYLFGAPQSPVPEAPSPFDRHEFMHLEEALAEAKERRQFYTGGGWHLYVEGDRFWIFQRPQEAYLILIQVRTISVP